MGHGIREDIFLRIFDVVNEAGVGFAFPTQTLHLARDGGPDEARREAAEATVEGWRRSGRLPFPRLTRDEIERLAGTLDYPPRGSAEFDRDETTDEAGVERLSAEPPETGDEPVPNPELRPEAEPQRKTPPVRPR